MDEHDPRPDDLKQLFINWELVETTARFDSEASFESMISKPVDIPQLKKLFDIYWEGNIPEKFPCMKDSLSVAPLMVRAGFQEAFNMWAIVDRTWPKIISEQFRNKTILELFAGAGWLSKVLREQGQTVIATDAYTQNHVTDIEELNAVDAVKKYASQTDVLLLSWPPYTSEEAAKALALWPDDKPVIYIGEDKGGCCATDEFFDRFDEHSTHRIPQWPGIHDYLMIGSKRSDTRTVNSE